LIDLHCHVLPGIDDGPEDMEGAVAVARAAQADGIQVVAATPHARIDHPGVQPAKLARACKRLQRALGQEDVDVRIVSGAEVDLAWAMTASEEDLDHATYGGRGTDVLVETPYGILPPSFEDRLYELFARRGVRVLLAHPERNRAFQKDPSRLGQLIRRGVLVQLTASALAGGRKRSGGSRLAHDLLSEGLAHVIATDSHRPSGRSGLTDALEAVPAGDRARASWMTTEAPAAILAGDPLPPAPQGRRKLRRRL
jgi:protein-tyrosine phosphatase